jgi:uncharacterized membrane protein
MHAELLILRFVHIVGGVFWVGSVMFTTFFLMPTLMKAGPAISGPVMGGLQQRKLMVWVPIVALLVILSGLRLMMIVSGGDAHWFTHRSGHTYSVAAALAIIAFLVGIVVTRPAMIRAGKLSQTAVSDETSRVAIQAEIRALQRRSLIGTTIVTWLLLLAATGMAIARYL